MTIDANATILDSDLGDRLVAAVAARNPGSLPHYPPIIRDLAASLIYILDTQTEELHERCDEGYGECPCYTEGFDQVMAEVAERELKEKDPESHPQSVDLSALREPGL